MAARLGLGEPVHLLPPANSKAANHSALSDELDNEWLNVSREICRCGSSRPRVYWDDDVACSSSLGITKSCRVDVRLKRQAGEGWYPLNSGSATTHEDR